jgi:DNA-binding MarR family transcriptional regulator
VARHWAAGDDPAGDEQADDQRAGGDQAHSQRAGGERASDQAGDEQAFTGQAGRVWAAMRALVEGHPAKQRLRDALDLGRGSGRVKSLIWLTEGPLSLSGLAEAIGVDAPYATLIVDSLEERGLVERQPDPADRRRKLVTLTPAGRDAVAEVLRIQLEPPPGFCSLSAAELDLLEKLVWRIMAGSR